MLGEVVYKNENARLGYVGLCRDDWIRTSDLYVPNVAHYRAVLHPEEKFLKLSFNEGFIPQLLQLKFKSICFNSGFKTSTKYKFSGASLRGGFVLIGIIIV